MRITQVAAAYNPTLGRVELFAVEGETFTVYEFVHGQQGPGWIALSMKELTEKDRVEEEEDRHGS